MNRENQTGSFKWVLLAIVSIICILTSGKSVSAADEQNRLANEKLKIFDGKSKIIVVNGYSTSFHWPAILQKKLDRYFDGKRVLTVKSATKGGTPIAKWVDVKTGRPLGPWLKVLRPTLRDCGATPVILLAQQSLQGVFGRFSSGIRDDNDQERIQQGADALAKYAEALKKDGADLVFVAMHIYKQPMEPQIGNERYAMDELMRRNKAVIARGPDVWNVTKRFYPQAFAKDRLHPNTIGSELMAQKWFETLLRYDGLEIPAWSKYRMPAEFSIPGVRILRELEYVPGGHKRNKLDLYLPAQQQKSEPLPLLIWVHGGAWLGGDKQNCPALRFLNRGYAVASINYRLSQHAIFPAQIEDCKSAIRWLRENSGKYNFDGARFGVWGSSAGGHLVALLGTAGDVKEFDKGRNWDVSSRVQAVCDFFGPTDFTKIGQFPSNIQHDAADSPEAKLLGGPIHQNIEAAQRANPIAYITKDDPPFLIVHGDNDKIVPHNQSQLLYEALKSAGVPVKFHTVKRAGHGFSRPKVDKMVEDFFDKHLKVGPN